MRPFPLDRCRSQQFCDCTLRNSCMMVYSFVRSVSFLFSRRNIAFCQVGDGLYFSKMAMQSRIYHISAYPAAAYPAEYARVGWLLHPTRVLHHTRRPDMQYAIPTDHMPFYRRSSPAAERGGERKILRNHARVPLICQSGFIAQIIHCVPPRHLAFVRADNMGLPAFHLDHIDHLNDLPHTASPCHVMPEAAAHNPGSSAASVESQCKISRFWGSSRSPCLRPRDKCAPNLFLTSV